MLVWGSLVVTRSGAKNGHTYVKLGCARHRNRGETVWGNATLMRVEALWAALGNFIRTQILAPDRIVALVEKTNKRVSELMRKDDLIER